MMANDIKARFFARAQQVSSTWTSCSGYLTRMATAPLTLRWTKKGRTIKFHALGSHPLGSPLFYVQEFMIATDMSSSGDPAEKLR